MLAGNGCKEGALGSPEVVLVVSIVIVARDYRIVRVSAVGRPLIVVPLHALAAAVAMMLLAAAVAMMLLASTVATPDLDT